MVHQFFYGIEQTFRPVGIGSYYIVYYFLLSLAVSLGGAIFFRFRKRLPCQLKAVLLTLTMTFLVRVILFDNPVAWSAYAKLLSHRDIGYRQYDVLLYQREKYRRSFSSSRSDFLAVGTSQVGSIFFHWDDDSRGINVFTLAGLTTMDYMLYREQIKAYQPRYIILYLSEFDIAQPPQLESLALGPGQGFYTVTLYNRIKESRLWQDYNRRFMEMLIGEFFPECKYSYVFKGLLRKLIGPQPVEAEEHKQGADGGDRGDGAEQRATEEQILQVEQFSRLLTPDAIKFNMSFLEDFIRFCRDDNIEIIILEGQYNPRAYTERNLELNRTVRMLLQELPKKFDNTRFIPRSELYAFHDTDYRDYTHVTMDAAYNFTRQLSARLKGIATEGGGGESGRGVEYQVIMASGWYQREGGEFRWSNGRGEIDFLIDCDNCPSCGTIRGEIISIHSDDAIEVRLNGKKYTSLVLHRGTWEFKPFELTAVPLRKGKNQIVLVNKRGAIRPQGDPRELAFAIKNFHVSSSFADGIAWK